MCFKPSTFSTGYNSRALPRISMYAYATLCNLIALSPCVDAIALFYKIKNRNHIAVSGGESIS